MEERIVRTAIHRKETQYIFYCGLSIKILKNTYEINCRKISPSVPEQNSIGEYAIAKEEICKKLFSFPGLKMLLRENGRLDRNMKLFEILPYVLTHIGTFGSL